MMRPRTDYGSHSLAYIALTGSHSLLRAPWSLDAEGFLTQFKIVEGKAGRDGMKDGVGSWVE